MSRHFLTGWRIGVLCIGVVIAYQLVGIHRELILARTFGFGRQDLAGVEEKLDGISGELDELWNLANELVK